MIITIDGPAASGKSTVAQAVAQKLQYFYLNSGMLYRALGYCLLYHAKFSLEELTHCSIDEQNYCLQAIEYTYDIQTGTMKIWIEKIDRTLLLKDPIIDKAASLVGENRNARSFLMELQQTIGAKNKNIVAEGRDVGSVVFPQAQVKFFLTADPKVRALRWLNDQVKKGHNNISFEQALITIRERDTRDANRPFAPLKVCADDSIVDNSHLTFEQTLTVMLDIITVTTKK